MNNEINNMENFRNNLQIYDKKYEGCYDLLYITEKTTRKNFLDADGGVTVSVFAETVAKNNKNNEKFF